MSAQVTMPPTASSPPTAPKAVARLPLFCASRRMSAASLFGQWLFESHPAALFLLDACNPKTPLRPIPITPTPAVARAIVRPGLEDAVSDEAEVETGREDCEVLAGERTAGDMATAGPAA